MTIRLTPLGDADVVDVADFLHAHLNDRVSAIAWADAIRPPWYVEAPNHGMVLRDGSAVVGAHLAFYSERRVDGNAERFCNLGAWCVLPAYRFHGIRLLKALLAQDGYHFTDLSPSGAVVGLNRRLGFRDLDTSTVLVPNLPWPSRRGRIRLVVDPETVEKTLEGHDLDVYRDHRGTQAAHQVVLVRGDERCHIVFRRARRRDLSLFASLLSVSDPNVLRAGWGLLTRHMLLKHGIPVTLLEPRIAGYRPRLSVPLSSARPKMFRSDSLDASHVDDLYSEMVCVPW